MKNMIKLSVIAGAIFVLSAGISANASAAGTNWKPVCVNGSDSQGNHNGTWSQINKETTAGGWTKVGRCIPPPPPPAPAPIVYVAPPAPMYSAPTYTPTAYTAPTYDPYAYTAPTYDPYSYTAPAYDPYSYTAPAYAPTAYTAPAYAYVANAFDPYAEARAVNGSFTGWVGGDPTVINIAANTATGYTGTGPLITGGGGVGGDGSGNLGSLITNVGNNPGPGPQITGDFIPGPGPGPQITGDFITGPGPTVTQTTPATTTLQFGCAATGASIGDSCGNQYDNISNLPGAVAIVNDTASQAYYVNTGLVTQAEMDAALAAARIYIDTYLYQPGGNN